MSNLFAIHSVGDSLITYLRNAYPDDLRAAHPCTFSLLSSGELLDTDGFSTTLSLYLYRVTFNEFMRNGTRGQSLSSVTKPLSVDLHYLLTIWASSALDEQVIMAWAMRELYRHPVLDTSLLTTEANWSPDDTIQLIPAELSMEELMRIWDTLPPSYRLSVPYVARIVQIDVDTTPDTLPVVAARYAVFQE